MVYNNCKVITEGDNMLVNKYMLEKSLKVILDGFELALEQTSYDIDINIDAKMYNAHNELRCLLIKLKDDLISVESKRFQKKIGCEGDINCEGFKSNFCWSCPDNVNVAKQRIENLKDKILGLESDLKKKDALWQAEKIANSREREHNKRLMEAFKRLAEMHGLSF